MEDNDALRSLDAPESACNVSPSVPASVPLVSPPRAPMPRGPRRCAWARGAVDARQPRTAPPAGTWCPRLPPGLPRRRGGTPRPATFQPVPDHEGAAGGHGLPEADAACGDRYSPWKGGARK